MSRPVYRLSCHPYLRAAPGAAGTAAARPGPRGHRASYFALDSALGLAWAKRPLTRALIARPSPGRIGGRAEQVVAEEVAAVADDDQVVPVGAGVVADDLGRVAGHEVGSHAHSLGLA